MHLFLFSDHLVEIRANASLRKSSETTVPAASQSQKSSKPSTSVTSASISLRRTNSLIPKSNRASTVVAAAAASQALAEKEAEILALKQHLDTSSSQWKKIFDTFCIFSQWSLNKKDQQLEKASRREKELKERVKALSEECGECSIVFCDYWMRCILIESILFCPSLPLICFFFSIFLSVRC